MPDKVKLEPCPACKTDSVMIFHDKESNLCWVECDDPDCSIHGPWRETDKDAVAAWNALPRKPKWTDHNHKDKTTWPLKDIVVLVDRGDGMKWFGKVSGIGFNITNEDGYAFTIFLDEEQKTRPIRWALWPGEE